MMRLSNISLMFFKSPLKVGISIFLIGAFLGFSGTTLAATASSTVGYYGPIDGYSYYNQAEVEVGSSGYVSAVTYVGSQNGVSVPSGYMTANARLYNASTNDLVFQSGRLYQDGSTPNFSVIDTEQLPAGSYYSKGATGAYNGNGYDYYYTFQSPGLTNY